MSYLPSESWKY